MITSLDLEIQQLKTSAKKLLGDLSESAMKRAEAEVEILKCQRPIRFLM